MLKYYKRLKRCFGCTNEDLAKYMGSSRQYPNALMRNKSNTHMAASAYILNLYIDEKIELLKQDINLLEQTKQDIKNDIKGWKTQTLD